jgi:regulator of replication initiation timing
MDNGMSLDVVAKALVGTKTALDLVSKISDIANKSSMLDLQENVISLRAGLVDIKESLIEAKEQNLELKEENRKLKEKIKELKNPSTEIVEENGYYYEGDGIQPICPNCSRRNNEIVVLSKQLVSYYCSVCDYSSKIQGLPRVRKKL